MKIRTYIRIAKTGSKKGSGYKVDASTTSKTDPIYIPVGYKGDKKFLPTVSFAVDLIVDDELFVQATRVIGEINVAIGGAEISGELLVPILKKAIKDAGKNKKK